MLTNSLKGESTMRKIPIALALIILFSLNGHAQTATDVESLRGLQGVAVLFSKYPKELEQNGLTMMQVNTEVELRLRKAGIKILTAEEAFKSPGAPIFLVRLESEENLGLYAVSIRLEFQQSVSLYRKPSTTVRCATWQVSNLTTVGGNNLRQVKDLVGDGVDIFANDFLKANPK
jgi:hypothetical protein